MTQYIFQLGSFPELSLAELKSVFRGGNFRSLTENLSLIELTTSIDETVTLSNLGGTVKILNVLQHVSFDQDLAAVVLNELSRHTRPTFSLTQFNFESTDKLELADLKKLLKDGGTASRYLESSAHGLPSANFQSKQIIELYAVKTEQEIILAQTAAVQSIKAWVSRDRHKPYSNRRKGMLPPKVARMMVNLALGQLGADQKEPLIYDPFCGTGTILMEAALSGCKVVGSDIDRQAVAGSQDNLAWLAKETHSLPQTQFFVHDISEPYHKKPGSELAQLAGHVQAIITEPFMGRPKPRTHDLPNIFRGLEKLYLGTFKNLKPLLAHGGVVVFIFPYAQDGKRVFSLDNLIDKLRSLGYTTCLEPLWYFRPDAIIKRQIITFKLID